MITIKTLIIASLVMVNCVVYAHGVVHQRIDELTVHVQQDPVNTQFLLERGLLYADDQNWQKAKNDFNTIRRLNPTDSAVDFHEAKMWFSANRPELSYPLVNRYLRLNPDVITALALRAKINDRLGHAEAAVGDFSRVIQQSKTVLPDMYLQLAKAQAKVTPLNRLKVHLIIQSGLDKLGSLVVLLKYGIDFDRQQLDYQSALSWFEKLPQQLSQQPFWLIEKADLLDSLKRPLDAKAVYQLAFDRLQEKKRSGRFNKADQKLLRKIEGHL